MASPAATAQTQQIQASAWRVLLAFFAIFCALVATGVYAGWRYYSTATEAVGTTLALKYVNTGVLRQQAGSNVLQDLIEPTQVPQECGKYGSPSVCDYFGEGQRLVGRRGAGFGPVASLVLPDGTRVNLHTQPEGFDFSLEKYRVSRWTLEKQEVVFEQTAGYARYDLARDQQYKNVTYAVKIGGATIFMAPGGSYSTDVPRREDGSPRGRLVTDAPLLAEVAVRRGTALIQTNGQTITLHDGDLVQIALDGSFVKNGETPYQDAVWQLVPDGDFSQFTTEQYNTPGQTTTWNIRSGGEPNAVQGEFSVVRTCPREQLICTANEQINYGQFKRKANDFKPFTTGVDNPVDADVSEYVNSLVLSADVSVQQQSVALTGQQGSECPIMIVITYKQRSPTDADQNYRVCVFTGDGDYARDQGIDEYIRIKEFGIYPISIDLRKVTASVKDAWYIASIRVEARGHDYISQVTRVSLVGK